MKTVIQIMENETAENLHSDKKYSIHYTIEGIIKKDLKAVLDKLNQLLINYEY